MLRESFRREALQESWNGVEMAPLARKAGNKGPAAGREPEAGLQQDLCEVAASPGRPALLTEERQV